MSMSVTILSTRTLRTLALFAQLFCPQRTLPQSTQMRAASLRDCSMAAQHPAQAMAEKLKFIWCVGVRKK